MKSNLWWALLAVPVLAGCGAGSAKRAAPAGAIAISVTENGFEPAVITVQHGAPVTLVVTRRTDTTCATEFVISEHGIREDLPLGQPVAITFTPTKAGEIRYACGMDMIAGKIVVR